MLSLVVDAPVEKCLGEKVLIIEDVTLLLLFTAELRSSVVFRSSMDSFLSCFISLTLIKLDFTLCDEDKSFGVSYCEKLFSYGFFCMLEIIICFEGCRVNLNIPKGKKKYTLRGGVISSFGDEGFFFGGMT